MTDVKEGGRLLRLLGLGGDSRRSRDDHFFFRGDVHEDALGELAGESDHLFLLERNDTFGHSHQGVVARADHIRSGMELGTTLPDQDIADLCGLTAKELDAEALGRRFATE